MNHGSAVGPNLTTSWLARAQLSMLLILLAGSFQLTPRTARGDRFGNAGQIVPLGSMSFSHDKIKAKDAGGSTESETTTTSWDLEPGILYFVTDDIATGGFVRYQETRTRHNGAARSAISTFRRSVAGAGGYNFELGHFLSIFPTVYMIYSRVAEQNRTASPVSEVKRTEIAVAVKLPLLVHLDNFFIGFGPEAEMIVSRKTTHGQGEPVVWGTEITDATDLYLRARITLGGHF